MDVKEYSLDDSTEEGEFKEVSASESKFIADATFFCIVESHNYAPCNF